MQAVIFDIDGTLSDPSHRLHHVENHPHNWAAFFDEMSEDGLHEPIRWLAWVIAQSGTRIILTSGRPETHRRQTEEWLANYEVPYDALYMRAEGDFRADYIVKSQMLDAIIADGNDVVLVVDDRESVIKMWRERGLTCLQCRENSERNFGKDIGLLTIMVGPSGAGKSTWLKSPEAELYGIRPDHIVSSDIIRADLCGNFRDQTKNTLVFEALHAIVKTRISYGLPCVVDATSIKNKDRIGLVKLSRDDAKVRYIVIDRPMWEKERDAGWRSEVTGLLAKHAQTFNSNLWDILAGDHLPNVEVIDLRR